MADRFIIKKKHKKDLTLKYRYGISPIGKIKRYGFYFLILFFFFIFFKRMYS